MHSVLLSAAIGLAFGFGGYFFGAWQLIWAILFTLVLTIVAFVVLAGELAEDVLPEFARKANPPLSYASGGNGSQHQLIMEMLKSRAGVELMHVPYKGGAPATTAAVSGEVAVLFAGASILTQVKSGKLRALAVSGERRTSAFDLPALGEFYPGAGINPWAGVYAPAATPRAIITRLNMEVNRVLAEPATAQKLEGIGVEPFISSPEEMAALLQAQHAMYGKIIRAVGVKLD